MSHEKTYLLVDLFNSAAFGVGGSVSYASVWPEILHGAAVIITGLVCTTILFFYKRILRKYFPEKNDTTK